MIHKVIKKIIPHLTPKKQEGKGKAPVNIGLCKYWGKRDTELNLPLTSSISLSLDQYTQTIVKIQDTKSSSCIINGKDFSSDPKIQKFLSLFAPCKFEITSQNDVPTGSGLATSASGFAALTLSLDDLFQWNLDDKNLSILARLGSGSASRSIFKGFVKWDIGVQKDGMDSYARLLPYEWDDLCCGLIITDEQEKYVSSREAMQTDWNKEEWIAYNESDLEKIETYIREKDFVRFGNLIEKNALKMHSLMLLGNPPVLYWNSQTIDYMHKIWSLRQQGLDLFFTLDAGPQIKVFFEKNNQETVCKEIPQICLIHDLHH